MPIYEFYCSDCHAIFNFLARSPGVRKTPKCPRCGERKLTREISSFAVTGRAGGSEGADDLPIDESKMETALTALAGDAEKMDENDPMQAARLMRKFSGMTGMEFGQGIEAALERMEAGEDPEKIESEMGDLLDEEPFVLPDKKGKRKGMDRRSEPRRDPKLYEM